MAAQLATGDNDAPISKPPPFARWISPLARRRFAELSTHAVPTGATIDMLRAHYDRINTARLKVARQLHRVEIVEVAVGGVPAHRVVPDDSVENAILICLHGGAFMWGAGAGALIEAVPVAATSGIRVLAVEYRLAPEHRFPAAVNDVLAVVRAVRASHPGIRVGIYGCSAGAVLTAQVIARLIDEGDAVPDAIAMLHAAGLEIGGDTLELAAVANGTADAAAIRRLHDLSYFEGTDPGDSLVFPGEHAAVLGRFPPSLLVSGTRDFAGSSVSVMHRRMRSAGCDAGLLLFDGMWHAHHVDVDLPESIEVFSALSTFFRRHLG